MNRLDDRNIDKFFGTYERVIRWKKGQVYFITRREHSMGVKKDCFAYRIGRCNIMTEIICKRDTCSFYKTKEEMERDRERYGFVKNYRPRGQKE